MNFNYAGYFPVEISGETYWITETMVNTWIIGIAFLLFGMSVKSSLESFSDKPTGMQNVIEFIVDAMDKFVIETMGIKYRDFGNWFFGVLFFILVSNLSGLLGFRPPTADLSVTFALSISTFVIIHYFGMTLSKGAYWKAYIDPMPVFLPINLIGEIATPISLSFRLFGNVLGGLIIMGMVYSMFPVFLQFGIPAVLHGYFDLFAGTLQSYIFTVLSMTFVRSKLPD